MTNHPYINKVKIARQSEAAKQLTKAAKWYQNKQFLKPFPLINSENHLCVLLPLQQTFSLRSLENRY